MAGSAATDDSTASTTGMRDDDRSLSGDSLSEWRSCERAECDSPSTSPLFWDTDGDDDDPGPIPADLFGRYTWRIEAFSKEKKREMKSEPFEAGGYKWYILVYPQGCDVSNHLSLFLCVANHDKLLPGWSHFAQFTIAVGNIDPKKMKYSDTLHRFWKKEHDWGWKKFMELSKIQDGFLVDDVLEIIAQVQVIREKVDRPFRCLDRPYRRELLRVYMTNVEQIYQRFVQERRSKLSKLIDDKMRWSSFRAFWSAIDPGTKHRMSREKADTVLKVLVKHFFVEKEVTSTLVMDSLYTSLKALEYQMKGKKGKTKSADLDELPAPMVYVDMDMFVLAGDVIALLERAAAEPFPCQTLAPKDDKSSQCRIKDGSSGEVYNLSMEREERRLTELGQKIIETFVLSHIFSGIEIAYQEAVALMRQEELIREEEAAGLLENQMKGKRGGGGANEKDKRAKKKQTKQKKNNRKVKDKERDEKREMKNLEGLHDETAIDDIDWLPAEKIEMTEMVDALEDCASDGSDMSTRGKNQLKKGLSITSFAEEGEGLPSTSSVAGGSSRSISGCCIAPKLDQDPVLMTLRDKLRKLGQRLHEKNIEDQKLLKAHFEARDAKAKPEESSNSSCSSEKPTDVPESPKHSSEVPVDLKVDGTPNKDVPDVNYVREEAVSGMPATNTEFVPLPATINVDPVSDKDYASRSKMKASIASPCCSKLLAVDMDKGTPLSSKSLQVNRAPPKLSSDKSHKTNLVPPKSPPVDRATPVRPKSSAVDKATPVHPKSLTADKATTVHPKSPAIDKAAPVHPKSPTVDKAVSVYPKSPVVEKAAPVRPKSPAVDKGAPVRSNSPAVDRYSPAVLKPSKFANDVSIPSRSLQIYKSISASPRLLQVDKGALSSSELPQTSPATNSEVQKEATSMRVTTTLSAVALTALRPSSAPVFPTPRTSAPSTSHVQKSTLLSRSVSEAAGRSTNGPSPSAPPYIPQTYFNAIVGKPGLCSNSASLVYQSASFGQDTAPSQSLSAYASSTSAMIPPAGRSDQLLTSHEFKSGLCMSEPHDTYQLWKSDGNVGKQLFSYRVPCQQMTNSLAYGQHRRDATYQQANSRGTEKLSRYGPQSSQFQPETTASRIWPLPQGATAEEFPHLDIINDLLEEDHINGNMPESLCHDYNAFGLPFLPRGNSADSGVASVSSPGRFNSTEPHYSDGFSRAYDMSALHGLREGRFPSKGTYGVSDMSASKPWLNGSPSPPLSIGVDTNGFHQQVGDFSNFGSGLNGVSVWRRHANGRW